MTDRSSHSTQINAYPMAIEKDDTDKEYFKSKIQMYQELKEQCYAQKNELKSESLEQKSWWIQIHAE